MRKEKDVLNKMVVSVTQMAGMYCSKKKQSESSLSSCNELWAKLLAHKVQNIPEDMQEDLK